MEWNVAADVWEIDFPQVIFCSFSFGFVVEYFILFVRISYETIIFLTVKDWWEIRLNIRF